MTDQTKTDDRPACCPVCVHLDCTFCGYRWPNLSRRWVQKNPDAGCPKCGRADWVKTDAAHRPGSDRAISHERIALDEPELMPDEDGEPGD